MPAAKTRHFGQLDSDFPPFADSGTYCEAVFPMDRNVTFDAGSVLPRQQRETAGSCGFSAQVPNLTESTPTWGLPSLSGIAPALGLTQFWSTLDSTLTGEGPRPGGWKQPSVLRTRGAQGGGQRRRRRTGKKAKHSKRGKGRTVRKRKGPRAGRTTRRRGRGRR